MSKNHCCKIDCDAPAEFEIVGESGHPDDSTHACEAHVGELLGTPEWLSRRNRSWTITALSGERDSGAPDLYEALDRLVGEVRACWKMEEGELRHILGNTNYQVVEERIAAAIAALAKAQGKATP